MPNIKLTNLAAYRGYWQAIAIAHKEVDGYKYGDKDVIKNDNRSDMPARVLWATPYERSKYGDRLSDNVQKTKRARVAYLKLADSEKFSDEDKVFDECEVVMEQIVSKIMKDKRGEDVAGVWTMIITDLNTMTGGPVELTLGSTKYYGWELEFDFMDNANLAYDPDKWN